MKHLLAFSLAVFATTLTLRADDAGAFAGEAGLQLYSLRDQFKTDVPGTFDKVKAYGFREVETASFYNLTPADYRKELDSRGLKAVSGHFPYERFGKDLAGIVAEAKTVGLEYVGAAWIPHTMAEFSEADAKKAAADFNKWGEALKKEGLKLMYHCHGYEFKPHGDGTFMDILIKETKPEFVTFEMDVFWVVHPGASPVKYLEAYPGRWSLMHLKDIRKGARTGVFTGKADKSDDVALGTGQVPWPAVLRAAAKSGVKHYFIEDESPGAPEQIKQSLQYLETLKKK